MSSLKILTSYLVNPIIGPFKAASSTVQVLQQAFKKGLTFYKDMYIIPFAPSIIYY